MARKKLQKLFALLLTFSLSMSLLSVGAFAAETIQLTSLDNKPEDFSVDYGTELEDVLSQLPDTLIGTVEQKTDPAAEAEVLEADQVSDTVEKAPALNVAGNADTTVTDEDADTTITDEDADTTVTDEDADTTVTDEDADTTVTDEDADTTVTDEDADTTVTDEDADTTVTDEDADTTVTDEDADTTVTDEDADTTVTDEDADTTVTDGNTAGTDTVVLTAVDTKADPAPEGSEKTVEIPVSWTYDSYDGWTADDYTFTADLGEYQYQNSTEVSVTVTVNSSAGARIVGGTTYETLDAAVAEAAEGNTIELLGNCKMDQGFNKALTFTGGYKILIDKQLKSNGEGWMCFGLNDTTRVLTFDDVEVEWNSEVDTAPWLMLSLSGTLNVTNGAKVVFTVDSGSTGSRNAIYMNAGSVINVTDGSTFIINGNETAGKEGQGIQLDKTAQSKINVTGGSTFEINGTNRGYVNSPSIYVEDSTFIVRNCTANASNGGNFTAVNSEVTYEDNAGHGLSANDVILKNSTLTADHNGYYGVRSAGQFLVDSTSQLFVTGNSYGGDFAGLKLTSGVTDGRVEAGAVVSITDNKCSGLSNNGKCTFEEGVDLTIMNNVNDKGSTSNGGGIYNSGASANLMLPSDAVIYNNHADTAGDDIFNNTTSSITFYTVGSDWVLDDCDDAINGWYDDSPDARWSAHEKPLHAVEFTDFDHRITTVSGPTYLKAAHDLIPVESGDSDLPDWEISKSKTATNLDDNYTSQVTLSLPAAQETLESDVVFVLDKSTSANVEGQMVSMLNDLNEQAKATGATINVGVVIFNKVANNVLNLTELNDTNLPAIETAIAKDISGGTNLNAGLLAGKAMLDGDTSVDANRKYLVLVSDGSTYYYCKGEDYATAYTISSRNGGDTGYGGKNEQSNDSLSAWECKYTPDYIPDWETYFGQVENWLKVDYSKYEYLVGDPNLPSSTDRDSEGSIPYAERNNYPINVDISLYNSYQLYRSMQASGYHCYAVSAETTSSYKFGPSYMDYLRQGETVSFDDIQNDIYYLLAAGSQVKDVMGYGTDNHGNAYDFNFVNDISTLKLTVDGETLPVQELDVTDSFFTGSPETACYVFGDAADGIYPYVLHYYANGEDGQSDECFVWEINVPVSNFAPVELTYSVKLANPQTSDGTYGQFDADGSEHFDSLLTNLNATLYPVDSNGDQGMPEYFAKPTVSYTNTTPGGGGGGDDDDDDDDGGTNIPDENTPTTDVPGTDVPGTDIPDENTPTTDVPGTDLEDPDVPLADVPKTGDVSALWLALSALSGTGLAGVTFLGRKKRDEE